jgi:Fe2+ transport system protein FeoA
VSASQVLPIECLAAGEQGTIVDVAGSRDAVCRLAEMGFQSGVAVRMVQSGKPCILAIGNHRLTFRGEDSAVVLVEVASSRCGVGSDKAPST